MKQSYFTAQETLDKVEGLHSLSTLDKWANFIQKNCHYQFHYEQSDSRNRSHLSQTKTSKPIRVFSEKEIERLNQVHFLMAEKGRDEALRQLFDSKYSFEQLSNEQLLTVLEEKLDQKLSEESQKYAEKIHQFNRTLRQLHERVEKLEQQSSHSSGGWFQRKR